MGRPRSPAELPTSSAWPCIDEHSANLERQLLGYALDEFGLRDRHHRVERLNQFWFHAVGAPGNGTSKKKAAHRSPSRYQVWFRRRPTQAPLREAHVQYVEDACCQLASRSAAGGF